MGLRHLTVTNLGTEVYVNAESDFPAPSGGVITLAPNTVYKVMTDITITNTIDLNNSAIVGGSFLVTSLTYTPNTGAMFASTQGGHLENLALSAPSGGTSIMFNMNDGTLTKNLAIRHCAITGSSLGVIQGYNICQFQLTAFGANSAGITFTTMNYVVLSNVAFGPTNTASTFVTFTGNFGNIQVLGGLFDVPTTKTGISVSGIGTISSGNIAGGLTFQGAGTYISGTLGLPWYARANGIVTVGDEVARGEVYVSTPALTVIAAADTPIKAAGTTTSAILVRTDTNGGVSNRIRYIGNKTRDFRAIAAFSVTSPANNKVFNFYIYKNGSVVPSSKTRRLIATGSDVGAVCISATVTLAQNDYIELWVENITDASDITIEQLNLSIS